MRFSEKLQTLRKQKGLTQEEAARQLFVSRAAVSKWESGRGYPNVESLKAIAVLYGVTIDELLSGHELLTVAEEDKKAHALRMRDRVIGLLDCLGLMYLFLPLFAQRSNGTVRAVSLLALTDASGYMIIAYVAFVMAMAGLGVLALFRPNGRCSMASMILSGVGIVLFSLSLQPYGMLFAFGLMMVKLVLLIKKR